MSRINEATLTAILANEINNAEGYDSDVLSGKRAAALDYYQGLRPVPPGNGRSGIVSTDVADAVHSLLAQIQPLVKTTQVEFIATSEQDEPTCQAETDIVRKYMEEGDGYATIYDSLHDALLIGNGWIKVYVDSEDEVTEEVYPPDLPDAALFVLSQPTQPEQTVEIRTGKTSTKVIRTTTKRELDFDAIPPENMLFNNDTELEDLRFVAERKTFTVSELIEDYGFSESKVMELQDSNGQYHEAVTARQGIYANDGTDVYPTQEAETLKDVYCCYVRLSMNNNNTTELRHVWCGTGGTPILKNEPADYIPYITGSAIPMPHRIQGTGIYEIVGPIQDGKTQILRQYLDNLAIMNQSRIGAVEGQVNMGDLTNGRINGVVRLRSPDALVPLPSTDIGPQAMGGLNYLDQVRTQRVGASIDFNEVQAQLASSSATAAAGQLANVEKMSGWYASNLINTLIKPAFMLVHKILRTDYNKPVTGKINNQWQMFDPSKWPERKNVRVTMGMTSVEKAQRINALSTVIQQQAMIIERGGNDVLTSLTKAYNAMSDWIRASDLGDPTEYLLDPALPEQQQAAQRNAQKAEEAAQKQIMAQKVLIDAQTQGQLQKQAMVDHYNKWARMMDAEETEAELTTKLIIADKDAAVKVDTNRLDNLVDLAEGNNNKGRNRK